MATILSDKELKKLLGNVIVDGDVSCLRPNSYILRLGKTGEFLNSGKEFYIGKKKKGIRIQPGHSVAVTSYETIDFSRETIQKIFPKHDLHGMLCPTTDLSREGIVAPATQIDAGYNGTLNWTITNTSNEERRFIYKEKIYRLLILKLGEGETPDKLYIGDYQGQIGYVRSKRKGAPVGMKDIEWEDSIINGGPEVLLENLVKSGYPWNLLGERFKIIDQQFKTVTNEYSEIHDSINKLTQDVYGIHEKQDGMPNIVRNVLNEQVQSFQNRWLIGAGSLLLGFVGICLTITSNNKAIEFLKDYGIIVGIAFVVVSGVTLFFISKKSNSSRRNNM